MTTRILDRSRPFGVVVGASDGTIHHQDGACFGVDDREVGAAPEAPAAPAAAPAAPEPAAAPAVAADPGAVTREELQGLHVTQIKKLVENAGLTLITGKGSKAKNIEQLLAG